MGKTFCVDFDLSFYIGDNAEDQPRYTTSHYFSYKKIYQIAILTMLWNFCLENYDSGMSPRPHNVLLKLNYLNDWTDSWYVLLHFIFAAHTTIPIEYIDDIDAGC